MIFPGFLTLTSPCGIHLWFVSHEGTVRKLAPTVTGFLLMYIGAESQTRAESCVHFPLPLDSRTVVMIFNQFHHYL